MLKVSRLFLIGLLLVVGCGKEGSIDAKKLQGTWQLESAEPAGNNAALLNEQIRFTADHIETGEVDHGDGSTTLSCSVPYTIKSGKIRVAGGQHGNCSLDSDTDIEVPELTDTKLTLKVDSDGQTIKAHYRRIEDRKLDVSPVSGGPSTSSTTKVDDTKLRDGRILKSFTLNQANQGYRFAAFHHGRILAAGEKVNDGSGCMIVERSPNSLPSALIKPQTISSAPSKDRHFRESFMGKEFDMHFVEAHLEVSGTRGTAYLVCVRLTRLGTVQESDFREHFQGYLDFSGLTQ
jgi:hypothetical protein